MHACLRKTSWMFAQRHVWVSSMGFHNHVAIAEKFLLLIPAVLMNHIGKISEIIMLGIDGTP